MKRNSRYALACAALLAFTAVQPALAADASSRLGTEIRKAQVSGYTLTYTLLDAHELDVTTAMLRSSYDGGHDTSHHLMVFVARPDGRPVTEGKVGYLVVQPNETQTKDPAIAMDGGFGSDVNLPFRGDYAITAKLALPDVDLVDTFSYTVK